MWYTPFLSVDSDRARLGVQGHGSLPSLKVLDKSLPHPEPQFTHLGYRRVGLHLESGNELVGMGLAVGVLPVELSKISL